MILKEKDKTVQADDPRKKSGEDAERQMAHYLKREFGKQKDCFVLNDLRLCDVDDPDEAAQMDHLLVTGFEFLAILQPSNSYEAIANKRSLYYS